MQSGEFEIYILVLGLTNVVRFNDESETNTTKSRINLNVLTAITLRPLVSLKLVEHLQLSPT